MTYSSHVGAKRKLGLVLGIAVALAALTAGPAFGARNGGVGPDSGGTTTTPPPIGTTPGTTAKLERGYAVAPADAPPEVIEAINAANEIVKGKPYCLGGGHAQRRDECYDCSGTISYALSGAGLLDLAMPSGSFMDWEEPGRGAWITTNSNEGHMYAVIAGLRLDTSMTAGDGPGWSRQMRSGRDFVKRHPLGL